MRSGEVREEKVAGGFDIVLELEHPRVGRGRPQHDLEVGRNCSVRRQA